MTEMSEHLTPLVACQSLAQSQRGGGGVTGDLDPMENHKTIGFLSNSGLDPLENHKATKPVSISTLAIIEPPAKRHLNGVSLVGR